jgi:signal transduction histidine kinase
VNEAARRRLRRRADALFVAAARLVALGVIVAAVYAVVVLGIGDVPTSDQSTLLAFCALASVVAALVYAHYRARIGSWARAVVRRPDAVTNSVVAAFSSRVSSGLPVDELLPVLVESLRSGLALSSAEVWAYDAQRLELALADPPRARPGITLTRGEVDALVRAGVVGRSWLELWLPGLMTGRADARLRAVPMVHDGELIAVAIAEREPGRPAFSAQDDETLALLGRQAALAFRTVRLGSALDASLEELRESRARVAAAADGERRRIERDLHDGAQQHLLGLAVNLRVARELVASDPARAGALLGELSGAVHAAIEELRELAHGIYPPLLAERGLLDALRGAVLRAGVRGSVDADSVGRYSQEIESTAYFCCVEALQNAAKHAPAAEVSIRLWSADGALFFEVRDGGPGFDAKAAPRTAGLVNMRDRVGAIGGTLRIDGSNGTCVTGALPLVIAAAARDRAGPPSRAG